MARYVVVDAAGRVVNAVAWDGVTPYDPGVAAGHVLIRDDAGAHKIKDTLTPAVVAANKAAPVTPQGSKG